MGDSTTHAVFYSGYWYLARLENGNWFDTQIGAILCAEAEAEKVIQLEKDQ